MNKCIEVLDASKEFIHLYQHTAYYTKLYSQLFPFITNYTTTKIKQHTWFADVWYRYRIITQVAEVTHPPKINDLVRTAPIIMVTFSANKKY